MDPARADGVSAVERHPLEHPDLEAAGRAKLPQNRDRPAAAAAEREVGPDPELGELVALAEHPDELVGGRRRDLPVEVDDRDVVEADVGEEADALGERDEVLRGQVRPQDLARPRVERDDDRRRAARARSLDRPTEQPLVAEVDAVEDADAEHRGPVSRKLEEVAGLHRTLLTTPRRHRRRRLGAREGSSGAGSGRVPRRTRQGRAARP